MDRIPIRQQNDAIQYVGSFYGQGAKGERLTDRVTVAHLRRLIEALPIGTIEVGCHPGIGRDAPGMYAWNAIRKSPCFATRKSARLSKPKAFN